jgi:hypothetical protein
MKNEPIALVVVADVEHRAPRGSCSRNRATGGVSDGIAGKVAHAVCIGTGRGPVA